MLDIDYVTGIKTENGFEPLENLDDLILLNPKCYYDAICKLGRVYMEIKEQTAPMPNTTISKNLSDNPDFWRVIEPLVNNLLAKFNLQLLSDSKAGFINVLNTAAETGPILFNLKDFSLMPVPLEHVKEGIKIRDESGAAVYSFDKQDCNEYGRMRERWGNLQKKW